MHNFFAFLLLLQTTPVDKIDNYIVNGGVAALVLYLWRQDRKDRMDQKAADDVRFARLAENFRAMVEANTTAMVQLKDEIGKAFKG